jgi:hypothetical protein
MVTFWLLANSFSVNPNPKMRDRVAAHLIKSYLTTGAPSEVRENRIRVVFVCLFVFFFLCILIVVVSPFLQLNIASRLRKQTLDLYTKNKSDVPPKFFDKVMKEVELLIEQNMGSFFERKRKCD